MTKKEIEKAAENFCGVETDCLSGTLRNAQRKECFIAGAESRQPEIDRLHKILERVYNDQFIYRPKVTIEEILKKYE